MIGGTQAAHMVQVGYNAQHKIPWHWPVPAYLVTKGIGTGIFMILALLFGLGVVPFDPLTAVVGGAISTFFMLATTALLVIDLERPERFLYILRRPQWRSWLARGAIFLMGFSTIVGLWTTVELAALLEWIDPSIAEMARPFFVVVGHSVRPSVVPSTPRFSSARPKAATSGRARFSPSICVVQGGHGRRRSAARHRASCIDLGKLVDEHWRAGPSAAVDRDRPLPHVSPARSACHTRASSPRRAAHAMSRAASYKHFSSGLGSVASSVTCIPLALLVLSDAPILLAAAAALAGHRRALRSTSTPLSPHHKSSRTAEDPHDDRPRKEGFETTAVHRRQSAPRIPATRERLPAPHSRDVERHERTPPDASAGVDASDVR